MLRIYRLRDVIRIDPSKFGMDIEKVALEELKNRYESKWVKDLGLIILVRNPKVDPEGHIIFGDGASYHYVEFEAVAFVPIINEIVEGIVTNVTNMGMSVRIGPIEGFVHRSQVSDEEVVFDPMRKAMVCKQSKKFVTSGDIVRARITSVATSGRHGTIRINLTMRQPFLGKLSWVEEYIKSRQR